MGIATELIIASPFDQPTPLTRKQPIQGWHASIGQWMVKDGALHGDEVAEDKHPSSCTYRLQATDLVITAKVRLGAAESIAIGCRDTVPPSNHLGRTYITPTGLWVTKMSGISKTTRSEKVAQQKAKLDPEQWYPVTIEVIGDQYLVRVGDQSLYARNDRYKDAKGIVALITKGQGAQFKDVALWHAKLNPAWKPPAQNADARQ